MALVKKVIANAKPRLALFKIYWKEELAPSPSDIVGSLRAAGDLGMSILKGRVLLNTMSSAATNVLIGAEIMCWFYVGEVIGRCSLIGYNV